MLNMEIMSMNEKTKIIKRKTRKEKTINDSDIFFRYSMLSLLAIFLLFVFKIMGFLILPLFIVSTAFISLAETAQRIEHLDEKIKEQTKIILKEIKKGEKK